MGPPSRPLRVYPTGYPKGMRLSHRRGLEVELGVARNDLAHLILALLHLLLEVEEEAVDVLLRPLRAVDPREHAPRRVLLRPVLEICDLAVFDFLEAARVCLGLRSLHKIEVLIEVVLERIKHVRFDLLIVLRARPQEGGRKVLLRLLGEVSPPRQVLSMLGVHVEHLLPRVLCLVLLGLEQRLHVDRDEVTPRESHEVQAQEGQVVVHVREDDEVEHLKVRATIHMRRTDLAKLRGLERIALSIAVALPLALAHHCLLPHITSRDRVRRQVQPLLQDFCCSLPER
mmetsp:Transcript_28825/g.58054  ORF Transcript_28825/g.58054 Transcript_28825/m.58054 type:complete len:286 (+) Transcript_28825:179-1036(+)